tara:strand:+ start:7924 stop:8976 length:1053 start_codon:yes stop_codon:yes gene_type:complete
MADGVIVPSRLGANLDVKSTWAEQNALFLKVFANEVLTTFEESNVMKDLHTIRTISSGKTAQFPVIGTALARYHTPGEDVFEETSTVDGMVGYSRAIKHTEKTIHVDDVLLAATSIANIDELKNHYEVRSIYAAELGRALAKRFDIATLKTLIAASYSAANIPGITPAGTHLDATDNVTGAYTATAAQIVELFGKIAQTFDQNDIPKEGRFVIVSPVDYYTLLGADTVAINRDFGPGGNVATGSLPMIHGLPIVVSNHLEDIRGVNEAGQNQNDDRTENDVFGGSGNGYNADLTNVKMIAGHKSAIGTVKLMDLAVESEYSMQKQATLMLAKYAMGHGVLRPEAAILVDE